MPTRPAPAAAPSRARAPWILGRWRDLLLFIATPALIVPAHLVVRGRGSAATIALLVGSFGAVGHHLPGMMRAYGDRALFDRFRLRFVVAPLFLATVCALFSWFDLSGLVLVAYVWGWWHGLAQTYGFVRIYDAKVSSSPGPWTRRLDLAMCIAWFGAAVLLSPGRMTTILTLFYRSGGPLLAPAWIDAVRFAWACAAGVVTVLFFAGVLLARVRGQAVNPAKLLVMASSFGFYGYTSVAVENILVGNALFEIFHDVQYLSIVWYFNRNRVEKDGSVGGFTRFLFRRSGALVGLYVGLVLAYGSLALLGKGLPTEGFQGPLQGFLVASALLHFYYDGFIWKVREPATRRSLGLARNSDRPESPAHAPGWLRHGLAWSLFVVPVAWLARAEVTGPAPGIETARAVAEAVPGSAEAQSRYGLVLLERGSPAEAAERFRKAAASRPDDAAVHNQLGLALKLQGRLDEAIASYAAALERDSRFAEAHFNIAVGLGEQGKPDEAISHYVESLRIEPANAAARLNLANVLAVRGRSAEALVQYEAALRIRPGYARALDNMGAVLTEVGRYEEAIERLGEALRLNPQDAEAGERLAEAHHRLGQRLAREGRAQEAERHLQEARRLKPHQPDGRGLVDDR